MGSLLSLAVKFKSLDSNKSHSINRAALARLVDFLALTTSPSSSASCPKTERR